MKLLVSVALTLALAAPAVAQVQPVYAPGSGTIEQVNGLIGEYNTALRQLRAGAAIPDQRADGLRREARQLRSQLWWAMNAGLSTEKMTELGGRIARFQGRVAEATR